LFLANRFVLSPARPNFIAEMSEYSQVESFSQRKNWILNQAAFDNLLARLDADRERAGEQYEIIRRKLVRFFEWRRTAFPEEHADEVFNRVARKIEEGQQIRDLKNFIYGVARMLFLEILREQNQAAEALEQMRQPSADSEERDESESLHECLEVCLRNLNAEDRELIIQYYKKEKGAKIENRKALAKRKGIPLAALRLRAHRLRAKIEECINNCLSQPPMK
jgi:DNA-directed RNA polymerase specialized sigma24 family protein